MCAHHKVLIFTRTSFDASATKCALSCAACSFKCAHSFSVVRTSLSANSCSMADRIQAENPRWPALLCALASKSVGIHAPGSRAPSVFSRVMVDSASKTRAMLSLPWGLLCGDCDTSHSEKAVQEGGPPFRWTADVWPAQEQESGFRIPYFLTGAQGFLVAHKRQQ
jgi:hypothetical protein